MAIEALHDLRPGLLVSTHHLAPVFRVELPGKPGGAYQVAEQHRELAAFGVGRRGSWGSVRPTRPHPHFTVLVDGHLPGLNNFRPQIRQEVVVEAILPLQGAIGDAPVALKQTDYLF
jgi:hypothetical protein